MNNAYISVVPAGYPPWVRVPGNPRVQKFEPVTLPVPAGTGSENDRYGYGYTQKYLWVTRAIHYSRLHLVFPIVKLTLATPDPIVGRRARPPPPPVLVEGEEEHEVEAILDLCMRWNRLEYLVKWKGYNIGDNTWVVHRDVHAPDVIV